MGASSRPSQGPEPLSLAWLGTRVFRAAKVARRFLPALTPGGESIQMPPAWGDCDSPGRSSGGRGGGGSAGVRSGAARGRGGRCAQGGSPWVPGGGHLRAPLQLLSRDREASGHSGRSAAGIPEGSPGMQYLVVLPDPGSPGRPSLRLPVG